MEAPASTAFLLASGYLVVGGEAGQNTGECETGQRSMGGQEQARQKRAAGRKVGQASSIVWQVGSSLTFGGLGS